MASALAVSVPASANLVLNGDFENHSASATAFNLTNAAFTAMVANATGFGTSNELDLVTGTSFGIVAQSGSWKVGLHQNTNASTNRDAFSLTLSHSLAIGSSYDLSFYAVGLASNPRGPVEFGVSDIATDFGTLVYSVIPSSTSQWGLHETTFTAPIDGNYLTVRASSRYDGYAFVDNISLTPTVPVPAPIAMLAALLAGAMAYGRRTCRKKHLGTGLPC